MVIPRNVDKTLIGNESCQGTLSSRKGSEINIVLLEPCLLLKLIMM